MTWRELTDALTAERGHGCEKCGSSHIDPPHHSLILRNKKKKKILDVPENMILLCPSCHRQAHTYTRDWRRWAWARQCDRFTREYMVSWLDALPLKVKPLLSELELL